MKEVYLLLGSNLGDSKKKLSDALRIIEEKLGLVIRSSSLYQTAAWGKTDQPDFINQVLCLRTKLPPRQLLEQILVIENQLGRIRAEKWSSRTIDIDILFYGDLILQEKDLIIPHPFLHLRKFTLLPLCEINPKLYHPVLKAKAIDLLNKLEDNLQVKKLP